MKKFIINILVFFAFVSVLDVIVGIVFGYLQSTRAEGRTGAEYYACMKSSEDIIIMGSSRATHHYIPEIITDSLGLSCFNAGQDGNGIILQYGRWKMISERYKPKMIIYDVTRGFDLETNDNMAYIDHLKPYCSDKEVKEYVSDLFPLEQLKLISRMYRYNYKFLEILSDCLQLKTYEQRGYIPLWGTIRARAIERAESNPIAINYDETKLHYLDCFASECKESGVKLVFVVSPYFAGGASNEETFSPVKEIAFTHGACYYYLNKGEYVGRAELFKDSSHLNDAGARLFTKEIVEKISESIIHLP